METSVDTRSTVALFGRENSQQPKPIFQHSQHHYSIHIFELIETLFFSQCDSCAWLSRIWLAFHVPVAAADTHHPPPHCVHIYYMVSINFQQMQMNVSGEFFLFIYLFFFTKLTIAWNLLCSVRSWKRTVLYFFFPEC